MQSQGAWNSKGVEMQSDNKFFNDILKFVYSFDAQKMKDNLDKPLEELKNGADIEDKIIFFFRIIQDSSASHAMLFEQFHKQAVDQMLLISSVPILVFLCLNRTVTQHDNLDVTDVDAFKAMLKQSTSETTEKMSLLKSLLKTSRKPQKINLGQTLKNFLIVTQAIQSESVSNWVSKLLRMNLAHRQYQYDIEKINTIQTEGMTTTKIDLVNICPVNTFTTKQI